MSEQRPSNSLVNRLRGWYHNDDINTGDTVMLVCEAADKIEALERQVDALSIHAAKWVTRALQLQQRASSEPPAALTTYDIELFDVEHGGSRNGVAARLIPEHNGRYYLRSDVDALRASQLPAAGCGACDKPGEHCARPHGICVRAVPPPADVHQRVAELYDAALCSITFNLNEPVSAKEAERALDAAKEIK